LRLAVSIWNACVPAARDYPADGGGAPPERPPRVPLEAHLDGATAGKASRWDVILLMIDSLRTDCLAAGRRSPSLMPALDRLASESLVFTDFLSQASHTSYAALVPLTGEYPLRTRGYSSYPRHPPRDRVLLHDLLKRAGYRTGFFSSQDERWGGMYRHVRSSGLDRFHHASDVVPLGTALPGEAEAEQSVANHVVDDALTLDAGLRWVEEGGAPYFAFFNLQSAHFPYTLPGPAKLRGPIEEQGVSFAHIPPAQRPAVRVRYEEALRYVDAQIGRLIERLKARGTWERTLLAVTADHGQAFYEHGFPTHASWLYDEVVRVPFFLRIPGGPAGRDGRPAQLIDVAPTILAGAGLPGWGGFQGRSLLGPAWEEPRARYLVCHSPLAHQRGIVRGGYKLLHDDAEDITVLYDLRSDPTEKRDLSEERPDVRDDLRRRLEAWTREQVGYHADEARRLREFPPRHAP
jgi:arylsulfatase A-like enzyme